jgi:hypothetical protein
MAVTLNASTSTGLVQSADTSGAIELQSNGTTALTINSSRNVGINTAPTFGLGSGLEIAPSDNGYVALSLKKGSAGAGHAFDFVDNSDALQFRIGTNFASAGNNLIFAYGTTPTVGMVLDSSGNLLVGQTSFSQSSSTKGVGIRGSDGLTSMSRSGDSLALDMYHTADGQIIRFNNTSSSPVGNINAGSSSTAYNTSSDYRLKENIAPMTGALDKVALLKPVTYKWKLDGSNGQGFIAHELQAVVPDCVTGVKDAVDEEGNPVHQGIDTSFLVATLTAALQELKVIVDAQAVRIAELEGAK